MKRDIKVGQRYHIELLCILNTDKVIVFETPTGDQIPLRQCDLECVSPVPERENTESAHKYDPCRKFRKGDIVEPSVINGRLPEELQGCYRYEVIVGEGDMSNPFYVTVKPLLAANYKHLSEIQVNVVFLKLATPVEELGPFHVFQDAEMECFEVYKNEYTESAEDGDKVWKIVRTTYFYGDNRGLRTLAEAKEAAEAERDRLNAEHRKEQGK